MCDILIVNIDCEEKVAQVLKMALEKTMEKTMSGPKYNFILYDGYDNGADGEFIPLIICKRMKEIEKKGYHIPDIFVFEQEKDAEAKFDNNYFWNIDAVKRRLKTISGLLIDISELKDWCIGALRIQLGLDEYCHGIKTWDPVKNPEQLAQRLKNAEQVPLLKFLYGKVIEEGLNNSGPKGVEDFLKIIEPHGTQVKFLKPFGKLNALFIDDEEPPAGTWRVLFNIRKLIYSPGKLSGAKTAWLIRRLENLKRDRYMIDFILLDLCIGDDLNNDPTGYGFLPVLRQFFPLTPIIVFSTFGDMGHISRAFREGATWYLSKADKEKLPRHLMAIYSYPKWEREWEAIRKAYTFCLNCPNEEKGQKPNIQEIQKFLIVSTLKSLPGYRIKYLNPNEGASSATTFIVEKEHSKGVVKIDIPVNTKSEYARYQRFIRPYLDNHAGRIYNAPIIADFQTSAIAYTFAGGPSGEIKTFRKRITDFLISHDETSCKTICKIIDDLYNLIARLHEIDIKSDANDHPDYPNLFYFETPSPSAAYVMKMPNDHKIIAEGISTDIDGNDSYFISRGIKKGKKNVHFFADQDLTPWDVSGDVIESAGMYDLNSFVFSVPGSAAESKNAKLGDELRKAFDDEVKKNNITPTIIHGDLNTGNIMLEENDRIWLIDFATTHRDCPIIDYTVLFYSILRDFMILLSKIKTHKGEILNQEEFNKIILFSVGLTRQRCKENPVLLFSKLQLILRRITGKITKKDKNWTRAYQYGIAMSLVYGKRNFPKEWQSLAIPAAEALKGAIREKECPKADSAKMN